MLTLHGVIYVHPNGDVLFSDINLIINKQDKIALTGNNGVGKSTLLNILAGNVYPLGGTVKTDEKPYYVPQVFGQFNEYTIGQALGIDYKLDALKKILDGHVTDENLALLDEDWAIEERCKEALAYWKLDELNPHQKMATLSGGQKTKVFLAGIQIHRPEIILLDEPTNHMDTTGRRLLYDYIRYTTNTLVVVSHDRTLLNLLDPVFELHKHGITVYGGNYDFFIEQKRAAHDVLNQDVKNMEKALRKAREIEKETLERKQRLDARGKKKQEKAGLPTISMNTLRNNAEKSTSRLRGVHTQKISALSQELNQLRSAIPAAGKMKMDLDHAALHKEKVLVDAKEVNFGYGHQKLWKQPLNFQLRSGDRMAIKGPNGSGKTTLIKMMLGDLKSRWGILNRIPVRSIYMDQDYSLIYNTLTVYEQVQRFNSAALQEHEIKTRLNRFLFTKTDWDKPCSALSGGEKMRLLLCALTIGNQAPDMIVLDEPTNNLDMQNIEILITAINEYKGTLIVVSHDDYFLKQVNVESSINLE